jgi:hypothetical protein
VLTPTTAKLKAKTNATAKTTTKTNFFILTPPFNVIIDIQ